MRISRISVENLVNTFNHHIDLKLEGRITIIHGMNGFGKTSLLRMVNGLFNNRYYELREIPFKELLIGFDDNSQLLIKKSAAVEQEKKRSRQKKNLRFEYSQAGLKTEFFEPSVETDSAEYRVASDVVNHIPGLTRMTAELWRYLPTNELLSIDDILERFPDYFPRAVRVHKHSPEWFLKLIDSIDVRFIETHRLMAYAQPGHRRQGYESSESELTPTIVLHSRELAANIQRKLAESAAISVSLDRTFPIRLVKQRLKSDLSSEEIHRGLAALEKKRSRLEGVGLLEKEQEESFGTEVVDENTKGVLSVYLGDTAKKLSVLDDLAERIDLFKKIVNDHFLFKKMVVNKERGFTFFSTRTNEELSITHLSSGEQHELVLLYELLFRLKKNAFILIDEPELSLHIDWQERFLKDLQSIIALSPLDVLIATHSPQIVSDRWDLTVELEGPPEKEEEEH